jgi:hypothetical protein
MKLSTTLIATLALVTACTTSTRDQEAPATVARNAGLEARHNAALPADRPEQVRLIPLSFEPQDVMTATRATPPTLMIDSGHLEPAQLDRLTAALSLITWPDARPVTAEVRYAPRDEARGERLSRLTLAPQHALDQRWYAMRLDLSELPEFTVSGDAYNAGEKIWLARFHVGSHPTLRQAVVTSTDEGVSIRLELSERVRDSQSSRALVSLRTAGRALDCAPRDDEALNSAQGVAVLSFLCPAFDLDQPLDIEIAPQLRALNGKRVTAAFQDGGVHLRFVPDQIDAGPEEVRFGPVGQAQ